MEVIRLCCLFSILLISSCTEAKPTSASASINIDISLPFTSTAITTTTTATTSPPAISTTQVSDLLNMQHLNKTCLTRDCDEHVNLRQLHDIASHMERSIDPCENFHQYACVKWQEHHRNEHTMLAVGERQLAQKYQEIFGQARERNERDELQQDIVYAKLQHYYDVCIDSESLEKASWRLYIAKLREMGYLKQSHWLETLRDLSQYSNVQYFLHLHVERMNASLFMLNIDPHNDMARVSLTQEIYDILVYFQYTNDSLKELQKKFQNLEMELENILNSSCVNKIKDESNECDLTEWMSKQELINHSDSTINWKILLESFALESFDIISVTDMATLQKINIYLNGADSQTLLLYAISRFVNHLESHNHNIVRKGSGSLSCLRHMRKIFPLSMNYIYEKVFYNSELRNKSDPVIESVFSQLKQQFLIRLNANQMQLSVEGMHYIQKKLSALQLNIGNVPKNVTQKFYQEFITGLNVTQNFYENHLNALKHFFRHQRVLTSPGKAAASWYTFNLHKPDFIDAVDLTAYYFCSANLIVLPFTYLQLPFYDHRFWPSLLFGDLANTLGHELMHAFDTKFLYYDFGGNYNDVESLEILNNQIFIENLSCLNKDPTEFLTERIADISGTRLALRTFAKDPLFLKQNGKLFFLQFAQFFCGSATEQEFALLDEFHDMDSKRLTYTLAHLPEFAEVFGCPLGSPMNPREKCRLW